MTQPQGGTRLAPGPVKLSANLPYETVVTLKGLAERRGTTQTEVLRRAIALEKWFEDEVFSKGAKVLVEGEDGTMREVVFR